MAEFQLKAGATVNLLSKPELDDSLGHHFAQAEAAWLRGVKWMRLPEVLRGVASNSAIVLGEGTGQPLVGPEQGYIWSLRRLVVSGLTSGTTPDVVNVYRSGTGGQPLWQFTGNAFYQKFGRLELTLQPGETIALASVGTFASTSQVILSGELIEVPAELVGKLA